MSAGETPADAGDMVLLDDGQAVSLDRPAVRIVGCDRFLGGGRR